jgi:hypothetical protein
VPPVHPVLISAASRILAAAAPASPAPSPGGQTAGGIGQTSGLIDWIQNNIIRLGMYVGAAIVILYAGRKNLPEALTVVACLGIGLFILGISAPGTPEAVGHWIAVTVLGVQ